VSLPARRWIYLTNLRDEGKVVRRGVPEMRGGHTEILIISLAMVMRNDPWNRKVVLRVCSQEAGTTSGTCFIDGLTFPFANGDRSQTVSADYVMIDYISSNEKKEKKTITTKEREKCIHTWNKQKIREPSGTRHSQGEDGRGIGTLGLVYVHALAHVLSGRLLFLPLHSAILPQS